MTQEFIPTFRARKVKRSGREYATGLINGLITFNQLDFSVWFDAYIRSNRCLYHFFVITSNDKYEVFMLEANTRAPFNKADNDVDGFDLIAVPVRCHNINYCGRRYVMWPNKLD